MPKSPVVVRFGKLDQNTSPRNAVIGSLTEATNVRQRKLGRYSQRFGRSKLAKTTDSGTISDAKDLGDASGSLCLRTSDTAYVRDAAGTWRNKGGVVAAMPTWATVVPTYGRKPCHCVDALGHGWYFVQDQATQYYWYRVVEESTGVEIQPLTRVAATTALDGRCIVAGGFVWLFYANGTTLYTAKFTPATPAVAPTVATYWAPGVAFQGFDVQMAVSGTKAAVVVTGANIIAAGGKDMVFSFLDPATGAYEAATGLVGYNLAVTGCFSATTFLRQSTASGYFYAFAVEGAGGTLVIRSLTVSSTDFSGGGAGAAFNSTMSALTYPTCALSGYVDGSGNMIVFEAVTGTSTALIENAVITRHSWTGAVDTTTEFGRARSLVSDPFIIGSTWYVVTHHDDNTDLQRGYFVQDAATGRIVGRFAYGVGGDVHGRAGYLIGGGTAGWDYGHVSPVTVSGTTAVLAVNGIPVGTTFGTYRVSLDFAPALGTMVAASASQTWIPGAWPQQIANEGPVSAAAPPMYPRAITLADGGTAGSLTAGGAVLSVRAVYRFTDQAGNVYRSAPCPVATRTVPAAPNSSITATIPTLRLLNSNTGVEIEVYASTSGLLLYAGVVANSITADTVTYTITATPTGEALYTSTGVASNYPPPPHRCCFRWRNRLWLTGTEYENEAWHSKEFAQGFGAEFTAIHKISAGAGGQIYAGGPISQDYAALLKRDSVHILSGAGPDDTGGGGSFQVAELVGPGGTTNVRSVVSYPGGLMFQGADGVIWRITPGLQVDQAGLDAADYAGQTVVATAHDPKAQEVHFFLGDATSIVLDYGNANPNAPSGYWYKDSGGWTAAAGAVALAGTLYHAESADGEVWQEVANQGFDGTTTPVLPKLVLAPLQLADLGGEFRVSRVQFVGEFIAAHTCRLGVGINGAAAVNYDKAVTATPERFDARPAGAGRVQELILSAEKTGTDVTLGFHFDGFNIEVVPRGRTARLNSGQRI